MKHIKNNEIADPHKCIFSTKLDGLVSKLNEETVVAIESGEMRVKDLLLKDIYEVDPNLRELSRYYHDRLTDTTTSSCRIYTCPRCKKSDHTYTTVQRRALDEPSTVVCHCNVCGFRFSIG